MSLVSGVLAGGEDMALAGGPYAFCKEDWWAGYWRWTRQTGRKGSRCFVRRKSWGYHHHDDHMMLNRSSLRFISGGHFCLDCAMFIVLLL